MNKNKSIQYTIRGVTEKTDRLVREKAVLYGSSLNETALRLLEEGVGVQGERVFHDLDAYAGTWVEDPVCDGVLDNMRVIDPELWP